MCKQDGDRKRRHFGTVGKFNRLALIFYARATEKFCYMVGLASYLDLTCFVPSCSKCTGVTKKEPAPADRFGSVYLSEKLQPKKKKKNAQADWRVMFTGTLSCTHNTLFERAQLSAQQPKYIGSLMKAAELRKKEYERRIERQIQKEREKEGNEFGDKEAFVTSSYKKKLLEKQEERERRQKELEDVHRRELN
ncbi:nuclear speckle splicing regulatory protein 1-like [Centruroides sculpturatus]|uniref:nuclear speckle splicing regulatory protein 1-like n=1 Tax=Centruroides sculpturatus TaxID=218467 RepID=UPI000C6DF514|nr:nuclear speckle splicing regulatory protein 1-like [Centruroides sculpturatus]